MNMIKFILAGMLMVAFSFSMTAQQNSGKIKEAPAKSEMSKKQEADVSDKAPVKPNAEKKVTDKDSATAVKKTTKDKKGVKKYRGEMQRADDHKLQTSDYHEDVEKKRREIDRMGIEKMQRQTEKKEIGETEKNVKEAPKKR